MAERPKEHTVPVELSQDDIDTIKYGRYDNQLLRLYNPSLAHKLDQALEALAKEMRK